MKSEMPYIFRQKFPLYCTLIFATMPIEPTKYKTKVSEDFAKKLTLSNMKICLFNCT